MLQSRRWRQKLWVKFREFLDKMLQGNAKAGEGGPDLGFVLSDS